MKTQLLGVAIAIGLLVGLVVWAAVVFVVTATFGWIPGVFVALLLLATPPYLLIAYMNATDARVR